MSDLGNTLGLRKNILYEILATTFSKESDLHVSTPNTSCMGIKLYDEGLIVLKPFTSTQTYKNLIETNLISINLTNNIYTYCLAVLKNKIINKTSVEFPIDYYNYHKITIKKEVFKKRNNGFIVKQIPYLKDAWAVLFCKVKEKFLDEIKDEIGEIKRALFNLKIVEVKKNRESYKLFNRAENLLIEALILLTRLDVVKNKGLTAYQSSYLERINTYLNEIIRFSENPPVLKSVKLIKSYLESIQ